MPGESSSKAAQKIGGEYGEIRANIDVKRLETYVNAHVKVMKTPLEVKQFKVSSLLLYDSCLQILMVAYCAVWAGDFQQ